MQIPSRDARPILRWDYLHSRRRVNIAAREDNEGRVRVSSGLFVVGFVVGRSLWGRGPSPRSVSLWRFYSLFSLGLCIICFYVICVMKYQL